ncbi:MAG TPA: hypothetical protein VFC63_23980 [Blastocatellia bacterium]|nr:hypothetical protein [Blastocatellia bacterium]
MFNSNSTSYSGAEPGGVDQSLYTLLNQVMSGVSTDSGERVVMICPISDQIRSYTLCDSLAKTASMNGMSVLLWNLNNAELNAKKFDFQKADLLSTLKAHNLIESGFVKRPDDTIWETQSTIRFRWNPKAVAESQALADAIKALSKMFDLIIMNCPPVGMLDEGYRSFAAHADSIVLVAKKGKTKKQEIARSVEATKGLPVAGFIMLE